MLYYIIIIIIVMIILRSRVQYRRTPPTSESNANEETRYVQYVYFSIIIPAPCITPVTCRCRLSPRPLVAARRHRYRHLDLCRRGMCRVRFCFISYFPGFSRIYQSTVAAVEYTFLLRSKTDYLEVVRFLDFVGI